MEAGVLCMIDGETFHLFMKNTWIGNLGASCHITNDETGLYDVTEINKLVEGSWEIFLLPKKGRFTLKPAKLMAVNGYIYCGP